jgi:biopolymer transport protein ExbB
MIDPTRGQLLNMLSLKPDLVERIRQGGIVGYIIIALAAIGLLLALVRYLYLVYISRKIKKQSRQLDEPSEDNALGRIAIVYKKSHEKAVDQKEVILEEAILKEIPAIERYNSLIKLLAAVSPLLGLLGTVTGMIITFQSITLFGTSDPKLMAGGISTALVTPVLGLSGAIPLLFAYTFIAAKSKSIIDLLEHQSLGLIAKEQ